MKSLTMTSALSATATTAVGLLTAIVMSMGGHLIMAHRWTFGDYLSYNMFLVFMTAPIFQIVAIGTQLTEAFAGLDRTNELMSELEENQTLMSGKHGQSIGGLKSQQKVLRERIRKLETRVFLLCWCSFIYYGTLIAMYFVRKYG